MAAVSDVMTTVEASAVLQIKDKLPNGFLINLVGKITAVSEIFRVKKDLIFLIEIENRIKIVVKQKQYLVWQEQITPEVEYIVTNLRATTLQKGSTSQVRVFVPWSRSCLYLAEAMEYCLVTLQDWLHSRSIILPEPIPAETSTGVSPAGDNFVAYQGVVTSCDRSSVGIFELDHRVSLYVTCVPASHRFTALTLGTKIIVYNAHRKGFAKAPKIRLFCCVATCIRVVEAGKEQSSNKQFSANSLLVKPISVYSLDASDVAALLDMPLAMTQKLHTQQCHLPISDTIPLIPVLLGSNCCPWLQEEHRNLLQEFLESPHACCVGRGQSKRRIPELVHISRETDDLSAKSRDLTDLRQKYYGSRLSVSDLNQQLYWSPVCETVEGSEGKLLIGYLQCSRVTGRLQLLDATGSVDLAVCSSAPPSGHVCCPPCVSPKPGQALTCPLVQPNLLGSIICVTRYKRIAERFLNTDVPNSHHIDTKYVSRSRHVLYLQISLTDCVLIHPQAGLLSEGSFNETAQETEFLEGKDRQSSSAPPSKRKRQTECDMKDESRTGDSSESQLVYISHKESLTTLSRKESPKLRFCVLGYLIGQAKSSHSDDPSRVINTQTGILTSCKSKQQSSAQVKLKENIGYVNANTSSFDLHPCNIDLNTSKPTALLGESAGNGSSQNKSSQGRTVYRRPVQRGHCTRGSGLGGRTGESGEGGFCTGGSGPGGRCTGESGQGGSCTGGSGPRGHCTVGSGPRGHCTGESGPGGRCTVGSGPRGHCTGESGPGGRCTGGSGPGGRCTGGSGPGGRCTGESGPGGHCTGESGPGGRCTGGSGPGGRCTGESGRGGRCTGESGQGGSCTVGSGPRGHCTGGSGLGGRTGGSGPGGHCTGESGPGGHCTGGSGPGGHCTGESGLGGRTGESGPGGRCTGESGPGGRCTGESGPGGHCTGGSGPRGHCTGESGPGGHCTGGSGPGGHCTGESGPGGRCTGGSGPGGHCTGGSGPRGHCTGESGPGGHCTGGSGPGGHCTGESSHGGSCRGQTGSPGSAAAQPAVLLFQDDVRWYSVLQVGCFYTMTAAGQGGGFQPRPLENKMRKAIESSHTRVCVQVPPNVGVTRVISPDHIHTNNFDVVKFADFSEVLSSSFTGTQVNMQGRIVSRSHRPQTSPQGGQQRHSKPSDSLQQVNQHLGVSVLDDQCVCLQVRSLTSDAEIPVYMNLQTSSYPLGLLPGAGVEFHRLERKVSRIENVYFQFTTVSTVTLFQVADSQRLTTAPDSPVDTESVTVPHQYIIDIWRCPTSSMEFTSTCYICHFMRLCLKSVCAACGSIVTTTGCSSQACTVSDTYLSAKVSVLVDDGTSPAVVSFSNCPEHVQSLLRLSPEQWRHLEVAIQEQGEVFLQQFVGEAESVLENFLMRLCSSQHVKRQCRMILQHRVFQHGRQNTWRSGVLDIHQMNKDEFTFRSVKANAMFETRCLPYLHLECLDLKEAGYDV